MFIKRRKNGKQLEVVPILKKEKEQIKKDNRRAPVPYEYRHLYFNSKK